MYYYYWAYGLTVKSEIAFPELYPVSTLQDVDLEIELAKMPDTLIAEISSRDRARFYTANEYSLVIPDVATYYAGFGKKIIIEKDHVGDWDSVRLFCLSNAFAAILYQRKSIPIHCSAFMHHEQLILIFGDSGAGKSTTLGAMLQRGYKVFSDDVCVPHVEDDSGEVSLYSSYPMMKYWRSTIDQLGIDSNKLSRQIRPDMDKYGLYFHEEFIIESRRPVLSFLLHVSQETDDVSIKPITGMELFKKLENNAYRGEQLGYADLKKEHFTLFTRLANQCSTFLIERPNQVDSIAKIVDAIEEKIKAATPNNID